MNEERIAAFCSEITRCFYAPQAKQEQETNMSFEPKDDSGAIFVNDKKEQDSHPDRKGTVLIGGVPYWVNGWLRKTKSGQPYLALSFKAKRETHSTGDGSPKDMD